MSSKYVATKSENETVKNFVLLWLVVRVSGGRSGLVGFSARLGSVSFGCSCVIPRSAFRLLYGWGSFVGVVCAALPCCGTCAVCGLLLVHVSALLILRAVYSLYIPALRNLMGFIRAKTRSLITSSCGQN